MKYLLDTNACIGYLNGRAVGVRQRLESMPPSEEFKRVPDLNLEDWQAG